MQGEVIGDAEAKTVGATAKINQIMKAAKYEYCIFSSNINSYTKSS